MNSVKYLVMRVILIAVFLMLYVSVYSAPIQINWENRGYGSVYIIERSVDDLPFMEIGEANESDGKFVDNNVEPLVVYKYRVKTVINGSVVYSDIEEGMTATE